MNLFERFGGGSHGDELDASDIILREFPGDGGGGAVGVDAGAEASEDDGNGLDPK